MEVSLEELKLRQQVALLKAQSLERDIIVINYKQLMEEAGQLQQAILMKELEVESEKHKASPDKAPNYPYPIDTDPELNQRPVIDTMR